MAYRFGSRPSLHRLFEPIDIASLVAFRVAFASILVWEVCRYYRHGWIRRYFVEPEFFFHYEGFGWLQPWPGQGMYIHFAALGVLALAILVGFQYRVATALFTAGFVYVFLLDETQYLNHFYLIALISAMMIIVPAHRTGSIDAAMRPGLRSSTAPRWALWMLRLQVGIVYFFGGVAKLNPDWLHGEPLRMWLAARTQFPLLGRWFTSEFMVYAFSYGGLLLDLLAPFMLLWRRTRFVTFVLLVLFNLLNEELFRIGIFPWFMIAATLLFFSPSWPRRVFPFVARATARAKPIPIGALSNARRAGIACLVVYFALQILLPLRHHAYPGNVSWTEEGHRFAWHMKLRDKRAQCRFIATDPATGESWTVRASKYLTARQVRKMSTRPDMILEFSHYVAERARQEGHAAVEIRVEAIAALNGRKSQYLVDPSVNLAQVRPSLAAASWIVPLQGGRGGHDVVDGGGEVDSEP